MPSDDLIVRLVAAVPPPFFHTLRYFGVLSSLPREQETVTNALDPTTIRTKGRHDPCLLPRFVPMAEAMVALVLADHWLRFVAQTKGV